MPGHFSVQINTQYCAAAPVVISTCQVAVATSSELSRKCDRVHGSSLIAVVKLIAEGVTGQAHGSLRGRHFGRLIMALDRLGRPMWCSRLPVSDSIAFLGSVLTAPSS